MNLKKLIVLLLITSIVWYETFSKPLPSSSPVPPTKSFLRKLEKRCQAHLTTLGSRFTYKTLGMSSLK